MADVETELRWLGEVARSGDRRLMEQAREELGPRIYRNLRTLSHEKGTAENEWLRFKKPGPPAIVDKSAALATVYKKPMGQVKAIIAHHTGAHYESIDKAITAFAR